MATCTGSLGPVTFLAVKPDKTHVATLGGLSDPQLGPSPERGGGEAYRATANEGHQV